MQLMMLVFVCYILILYHLISEMKRFFVPRASIENVSVVQSEAEVEEPSPNIIVFESWIDKISSKLLPRLSNFPRVATGDTLLL
jgi:hypothetical protein